MTYPEPVLLSMLIGLLGSLGLLALARAVVPRPPVYVTALPAQPRVYLPGPADRSLPPSAVARRVVTEIEDAVLERPEQAPVTVHREGRHALEVRQMRYGADPTWAVLVRGAVVDTATDMYRLHLAVERVVTRWREPDDTAERLERDCRGGL